MLTGMINFVLVAALATVSVTIASDAQTWPHKSVMIIVPFAAGGNTDGIARIIGQDFSERLGQQFVVENRPGAGGAIAAEAVAQASPDGYTLFMAATPQIAIVPAITKTRYDPVRDFAPISVIGTNPFVLAVNQSFPAKTLAEFVAYVGANPEKLSYASGGVGSLNHLSMALFLKVADLKMIHVIYKGNGPALSDVIAGHVPVMFTNLSDGLPQAKAGNIRFLAVSNDKRMPQVADLPTVSESGYPTFKTLTWNGLMAPAGTPKEITDLLAAEVARAVKDPKFVRRLVDYGVDPLGNSSQEFAAMIASDIAFWAEAVKAADVKVQ